MNLKIYQIDLDRDSGNVCFLNYEGLSKIKDSNAVDSSIYNEVFSGEVECENLNEIYLKFNIDTPDDYKGRSLSVSDVIEIKAPSEENKFYFCDSIGFKEIDFDVSQTQKLPDNSKITVLLLKPGEVAKEVKIDNTLEAHQKIVGGYIEVCMPFEDNAAIICNVELFVMCSKKAKRPDVRAFRLTQLHIIRMTFFRIVSTIVINLHPPPKA